MHVLAFTARNVIMYNSFPILYGVIILTLPSCEVAHGKHSCAHNICGSLMRGAVTKCWCVGAAGHLSDPIGQSQPQGLSKFADLPPGLALGSPNGLPLQSAGQLPSQLPSGPPQLPSDLPPGFVTTPASGMSKGRPSQLPLPSQLPSDLPPGLGTAPVNGLPVQHPNRQPSQGAHSLLVPEALPRLDLSQAGSSETASTSQTGSDVHPKSKKAVLSPAPSHLAAASQPPLAPSESAAAEAADLPPGFGAGHQGLPSAAVQSREARLGSRSGHAMPDGQQQRQQQVVAVPGVDPMSSAAFVRCGLLCSPEMSPMLHIRCLLSSLAVMIMSEQLAQQHKFPTARLTVQQLLTVTMSCYLAPHHGTLITTCIVVS